MFARMLCLTCFVVFATSADSFGDDRGKDGLERLRGEWVVKELVVNGRPIDFAKARKAFTVQIDGNVMRYSFVVSGHPVEAKFSVSLETDASPHAIDAKLMNGAWAGSVCKGIYELRGESLTLCLPSRPRADRPRKLESTPGSRQQLFVLERSARVGKKE